jgi:hypothetical protein
VQQVRRRRAWAGDDRLVLECAGQGDQPGDIVVQQLTPTLASGRAVDRPDSSLIPAYDTYSAPTRWEGTTGGWPVRSMITVPVCAGSTTLVLARRSRSMITVPAQAGSRERVGGTAISGPPHPARWVARRSAGTPHPARWVARRSAGTPHPARRPGLPKDLPLNLVPVVLMPVLR